MSLANNSSPSSREPYTDSNNFRYTKGRLLGETCLTLSATGSSRLSRIYLVRCKSEIEGPVNRRLTLVRHVPKSGSLNGLGIFPEKDLRWKEAWCDGAVSFVRTMCSTNYFLHAGRINHVHGRCWMG